MIESTIAFIVFAGLVYAAYDMYQAIQNYRNRTEYTVNHDSIRAALAKMDKANSKKAPMKAHWEKPQEQGVRRF